MLESGNSRSETFEKLYLTFQTHGNAIIDLAFSEDDELLATASGDQTSRIIDMMTQTPLAVLDHHTASLKQVRFQPGIGQGNILATSSRDGSVRIWDLRCKNLIVQDFSIDRQSNLEYALPRSSTRGGIVNSILGAHARTQRQARQQGGAAPSADMVTRWEVAGRIGELSVTAIEFMPAGKEHLLLSACEADASIKLWDIRNIYSSRQKASTPISFTAQPSSHTQWRPFGISAMSLSGDGARLYAVCKDNAIYAYATSHLVLGHAPELSSRGDPPRRRNGTAQEGLGPIYGFRHDRFHATSFYIKSAIRPVRNGLSELLAVGSSDGCAVVIPTAERYFDGRFTAPSMSKVTTSSPSTSIAMPDKPPLLPPFSRSNSMSNLNTRPVDTIPIHRFGTALVRGHEKEVGALTWTTEGKLVTVGDDYLVRRWSEDQSRAAELRTGGEGEGRRWACGWARVGADYDDEW